MPTQRCSLSVTGAVRERDALHTRGHLPHFSSSLFHYSQLQTLAAVHLQKPLRTSSRKTFHCHPEVTVTKSAAPQHRGTQPRTAPQHHQHRFNTRTTLEPAGPSLSATTYPSPYRVFKGSDPVQRVSAQSSDPDPSKWVFPLPPSAGPQPRPKALWVCHQMTQVTSEACPL